MNTDEQEEVLCGMQSQPSVEPSSQSSLSGSAL
jgi:hypothetical protein